MVMRLAWVALILGAVLACGDDDDDEPAPLTQGHTSPYPACNAIIQACHELDFGAPGLIHDCHDIGAGGKSDADCAPRKDECVAACTTAARDGG